MDVFRNFIADFPLSASARRSAGRSRQRHPEGVWARLHLGKAGLHSYRRLLYRRHRRAALSHRSPSPALSAALQRVSYRRRRRPARLERRAPIVAKRGEVNVPTETGSAPPGNNGGTSPPEDIGTHTAITRRAWCRRASTCPAGTPLHPGTWVRAQQGRVQVCAGQRRDMRHLMSGQLQPASTTFTPSCVTSDSTNATWWRQAELGRCVRPSTGLAGDYLRSTSCS